MLDIDEDCVLLLKITAKDLQRKLNEDKQALCVRQGAFCTLLDNDEEVQVHVVVTRDKREYLEPMQTEVTNQY